MNLYKWPEAFGRWEGCLGVEEQSFAQKSGVTTLDPMKGRPLCANSTFLSSSNVTLYNRKFVVT